MQVLGPTLSCWVGRIWRVGPQSVCNYCWRFRCMFKLENHSPKLFERFKQNKLNCLGQLNMSLVFLWYINSVFSYHPFEAGGILIKFFKGKVFCLNVLWLFLLRTLSTRRRLPACSEWQHTNVHFPFPHFLRYQGQAWCGMVSLQSLILKLTYSLFICCAMDWT